MNLTIRPALTADHTGIEAGVTAAFKGDGEAVLVRAGLEIAASEDFQAVIVLGHLHYYPRFGFSADLAQHLAAPFRGPSFMALELQLGALMAQAGQVTYAPAFGIDTAH